MFDSMLELCNEVFLKCVSFSDIQLVIPFDHTLFFI